MQCGLLWIDRNRDRISVGSSNGCLMHGLRDRPGHRSSFVIASAKARARLIKVSCDERVSHKGADTGYDGNAMSRVIVGARDAQSQAGG